MGTKRLFWFAYQPYSLLWEKGYAGRAGVA
jgi:hypothetical protein